MHKTNIEEANIVGSDRNELVYSFNENVKKLRKEIEKHRCLIVSIMEKTDEANSPAFPEQCPRGARELILKAAIKAAIDELEESRKAFKSKRLEVLRKKLTQVLIDVD